MAVRLYTSRIILDVLGFQDFGIYSVVGGVVSLFAVLSSAMSTATQRFLAIDIGKKDWGSLHTTFNATLIIHIGIALIILFFGETVGLWLVNYKLNIPEARMEAANVVYQYSVLGCMVGITQVPFNALIIARERMSIFALFSIVEVFLKLLIVYLLYISPFDSLKTFSFLLFLLTLFTTTIYKIYCLRHFPESKFKWVYKKALFKTLISYSGWSLFGNAAYIAKGQGVNMLLNIFFGTVVNAAYGVMMQVQTSVNLFVSNFQTAVNPQIIKLYANRENREMQKLMYQSAKFSYFLMLIIGAPIIFNIDFILEWWLKNPPKFTSIFVTLCIINLMIECLSRPLSTGAMATGKIKWFQIIVGTTLFLNLPISYLAFKISHNPVLFLYVAIAVSFVTLALRLMFLTTMVNLKIKEFLKDVIFPITVSTSPIILILYGLTSIVGTSTSFLEFIGISIVIVPITALAIFFLGFKNSERALVLNLIVKKLKSSKKGESSSTS